MPNYPKFAADLSAEETEEGASEMEIAWQGDNPCDACGRHHYTEETACTVPDSLTRPGETPQHCRCWYDCEPCCKCGDEPVVLHGPVLRAERSNGGEVA